MKNKIFYSLLIIILTMNITGCHLKTQDNNQNNENNIEDIQIKDQKEYELKDVTNKVKAIINEKEYIINLGDNETVKSFINLLPQEFNMSELNGNEKYIYLDTTLPTEAYNPKHINKGDVMLYGNNCLVIFYKSFDTSYSYTKIGHIDNLPDLGSSSIKIKIEK